jgi:hypothetical protein
LAAAHIVRAHESRATQSVDAGSDRLATVRALTADNRTLLLTAQSVHTQRSAAALVVEARTDRDLTGWTLRRNGYKCAWLALTVLFV